jgi:hypothetical protein
MKQVDFKEGVSDTISVQLVPQSEPHNKKNCSNEDKVFWDVTPCRLVNSYRSFDMRGAFILRLKQS